MINIKNCPVAQKTGDHQYFCRYGRANCPHGGCYEEKEPTLKAPALPTLDGAKPRRINENVKKQILGLYEDGELIKNICEKIGVCAQTIQRLVKEAGLPGRYPERDPEKLKRIIEMYRRGVKISEISDRTGATENTIRRIAAKHGLPPRRKY